MNEYDAMYQYMLMSQKAFGLNVFKEFTIAYHAKQLETICEILKIFIPISHSLIKKDNFIYTKGHIKIIGLGKMIFVGKKKKYISLSSYNFKLSDGDNIQISYYDIVENNPERTSAFIDEKLPLILANDKLKKQYYDSLPIMFA